MDLQRLLDGLDTRAVHGAVAGVHVELVTADSREAGPGGLFVAVRGTAADGHRYIDAAVQAGVVAVCGEESRADLPVPYIEVVDSRVAVAHLAEAVQGWPSRDLRLVGVTGTNGKTSTATLTRTVCDEAGLPAGVIGTVQYDVGDGAVAAGNTTPGPVELSGMLAAARDNGKQVVVLEVSSHALDQARADALEFDVAVFTNCTQDHLDYHGDMERYFGAKRRLFELLSRPGAKKTPKRAVVNADDPYGPQVVEACTVPVWTYGLKRPADFRATHITLTPTGSEARVTTPSGDVDLHLRLLGAHNVANAVGALAAAEALGVSQAQAVAALNGAACVPGRCETVDAGQPFSVMVDYAHTPDGIRALLEAARTLRPKRVVVVFGCGGDRDRTKRPEMGRLVAELADAAVVTSDNPRTEDPLAIMLDIEVGVKRAGWRRGDQYEMEPDRRAAIAKALDDARPDELVVIAGKGHEDYQIVGTERRHFDDREVARELLAGAWGGPRMIPRTWYLDELAKVVGGDVADRDAVVKVAGVTTDSRSVRPDELFVALQGPNFDGHRFLHAARGAGAAAAIVRRGAAVVAGMPAVRVDDPLTALGDFAAAVLQERNIPVVGITGSCGKTTTKNLTAAALGGRYTVGATPGNLNNLIGVPLSIFQLPAACDIVVLELATSAPGEIARLSEITQPRVGVITNIAAAHLEGLQTLEGVRDAKAELLKGLAAAGTLILNADDPTTPHIRQRFGGTVVTFGFDASADVRATDVQFDRNHAARFTVDGQPFLVHMYGRAAVANALAATAVARAMDVSLADVAAALEGARAEPMRMEIHERGGICLVNDAYNANPYSMRAAMAVFENGSMGSRKIAVLGDMLELGEHAEREHRALGRRLAESGVDLVYAYGEFAGIVRDGAVDAGFQDECFYELQTHDEIVQSLRFVLRPGDVVLIKGSRGAQMEKVADGLQEVLS